MAMATRGKRLKKPARLWLYARRYCILGIHRDSLATWPQSVLCYGMRGILSLGPNGFRHRKLHPSNGMRRHAHCSWYL
jgi:hypothetical protein